MSTNIYSLDVINNILFEGFNYKLPDQTLKIISEIALQVGSPDYVKTPVFQKRENPLKVEHLSNKDKKNKKNKPVEIINDEDWETIRTFQSTKIEEKTGIASHIDSIRVFLNKLTDKNYIDIRNKITEIIDKLLLENVCHEEMFSFSTIIFDIASTNRFYSKIYADLYSDLITKYGIMRSVFEKNLLIFTELFNNIEYVDPAVNYDKFCEINKTNEKRKSLASFYINLMNNGIITKNTIINITRNLLSQIYLFISQDDKKNEVDELTETISILYKKEIYENNSIDYPKIDNYSFEEVIKIIANSKVKDYKSLTNKSLFKFMDLIDM
jgi:hypothetical protein